MLATQAARPVSNPNTTLLAEDQPTPGAQGYAAQGLLKRRTAGDVLDSRASEALALAHIGQDSWELKCKNIWPAKDGGPSFQGVERLQGSECLYF